MFQRAERAMDTRVEPAYDVAVCCDALLPNNLSNWSRRTSLRQRRVARPEQGDIAIGRIGGRRI
jgi:hypothetical protein